MILDKEDYWFKEYCSWLLNFFFTEEKKKKKKRRKSKKKKTHKHSEDTETESDSDGQSVWLYSASSLLFLLRLYCIGLKVAHQYKHASISAGSLNSSPSKTLCQ